MGILINTLKLKEIYEDKVNTNFQGKKVPKENLSCECLLIIIDAVIRVNKKYYLQTFRRV